MVALAIGVFGCAVERRLGTLATLTLILATGTLGMLAADAAATAGLSDFLIADGGNGVALGLLGAWLMLGAGGGEGHLRRPARHARRRGRRRRPAAPAPGRARSRPDRRARRRRRRARHGPAGGASRQRRAGVGVGARPLRRGGSRGGRRSASSRDRGSVEAEAAVAAAAPALQRVLVEALADGGWFEDSHRQELERAAAIEDPQERATAVATLLAEETRIAMMVGVAVGWALSDELS